MKKVLLKILQNLQENTASLFLINLQVWGKLHNTSMRQLLTIANYQKKGLESIKIAEKYSLQFK